MLLSQWTNTISIDFSYREIFANKHLNQLTSLLVVVNSIISYTSLLVVVCFLNFEEIDPPIMLTMQQLVALESSNKVST